MKKLILTSFSLLVILLIGSAVALRIKYPPEKIKQIALEGLSKKLNREVSFAEISLNLFTGLSLTDFKCSEQTTFQSGTFVECAKFTMGVNLLSLLQKELTVDSIKLRSPKINIIRKEDGKTYNFSDLISPATTSVQTKPKQIGSGLKISVTKLKITNGELKFIDQSPTKIEGSLILKSLSVQGTSWTQALKVDLETRLMGNIPGKLPKMEGAIEFSGTVHPLTQTIKADRFVFKIQKLYELNLKGSMGNFAKPEIDATLEISNLSFQELLQIVPLEKVPPFLKVLKLTSAPKIKLKTKGQFDLDQFQKTGKRIGAIDFEMFADLMETGIDLPPYFRKEAGVPLHLDMAGKWSANGKETIEYSKLNLKYHQSLMSISGKITEPLSGNPRFSLNLKGEEIDLSEIHKILQNKLPKEAGFGGKLNFDSSVDGEIDQLNMRFRLDMTSSQIEWEDRFSKLSGIPLQLSAEGHICKRENLELKALNLKYDQSELAIEGKVDQFKSANPSFNLKIDGSLKGLKELPISSNISTKMDLYGTPSKFAAEGETRLGTITLLNKIALARLNEQEIDFSGQLSSEKIDLKELAPIFTALNPLHLEGTIKPNFSFSGKIPFHALPKLNGSIQVNNLGLTPNGLIISRLNGKLKFEPDLYILEDFSGNISGTPMKLRLSIKDMKSPQVNLDAEIDRLDLSGFTSEKKRDVKSEQPPSEPPKKNVPESKFIGKLKIKELLHKNFESGNIAMDWNLTQFTPDLSKVSGTAKLRTFGGEVKNIGAAEKILKIIDPDLSLLQFSDIGGDFNFSEGNMNIQDFWIESDQLNIGGEGKVSFAAKNCNIQLLARYSGKALAASVPISITGPFSSPKIEKKALSILSATLQEKLLKVRPKTKEEIAEKKELKEQKALEKQEEQKTKEEEKKTVAEEKKEENELRHTEKEEEQLLRLKEKEEEKKAKEEERLERLREKEEERLERAREREEQKRQKKEGEEEEE